MSGKELETQALNKKSGSSAGFFSLFLPKNIFDDETCGELFNKAGNAYVLEKKFKSATRCYINAYEEYKKSKNYSYYAIKNLTLAVQYGKQTGEFSQQQIISFLTIIAQNYGLDGKMRELNAKYLEISQIHEENGTLDVAINVLENCVNTHNLSYDEILDRKAELYIKLNKYNDAILQYETLINVGMSRDNKIYMIIQLRQYVLSIILCKLAMCDIVGATNAYKKYIELAETFEKSYEGCFSLKLINAVDIGDITEFQHVKAEYIRLIKLKQMQTVLIDRIQNHINSLEFENKDEISSIAKQDVELEEDFS